MAPLTQETDASGQAKSGATPGNAKPQPVAVEIPITVNGARTVAGSDKREPFSESSQTVLVFGSGAVIRLGATVGPGQLLFVTNEKSKKEVVCQVVKSKQNGSAGGYVELKFTEPAVDFWGVRFPGASPAPATSAAAPVTSISAASVPAKSLEEKLAELKSEAVVTIPEPPKAATVAPVVTLPSVSPAPLNAPAAQASVNESKLAPVVTMPAPVAAPPPTRVPTLSEFLTQGANGPELSKEASKDLNGVKKAGPQSETPEPVREPAAVKPAAPAATVTPAREVPALSVALGIQQKAAASTLDFDLAAEEVKIPSWLEPLARNSGTVADAKAADPKPVSAAVSETVPEETKTEEQAPSEAAAEKAAEESPVILGEGRAPNFAGSLPFGSQAEAKSSGNSWKIVAAILALALVGGAVWYWYVNQPPKVSASENREAAGNSPESAPAPAAAPSVAPGRAANSNVAASGSNRSIDSPAALNTPVSASPVSRAAANTNREVVKETPKDTPEVEEPAKKPGLGEVHLAAPKVNRKDASQDAGAADPGLSAGTVAGDASNLASKGKGPAAPVTIGGDVTPVQLISSVPPVYPQLARSQRVSGDVTVDALIDTTGHVSVAKVISGSPLLHQAAIDAVKQWRYHPATLNGQPTSMHLTVTVQFRLQ